MALFGLKCVFFRFGRELFFSENMIAHYTSPKTMIEEIFSKKISLEFDLPKMGLLFILGQQFD